jgi:formylglycine-generating enzyme
LPWVPAAGSGKHTHLPGGGLNAGGSFDMVYERGWDPSWDSHLPTTKADWDTRLTVPCETDTATWNTWTPNAGPNEHLPINCIDWYTAYAFCIWDGGFLPSVTEWYFAAAGGRLQREFAWGDDPPSNSMQAIYDCMFHAPGNLPSQCVGANNLAAVGYADRGQAFWGQMDMTGNVSEWNLDLYDGTYANPCNDCANFTNGDRRNIRGGGFSDTVSFLYNSYAQDRAANTATADIGVRCARPPSQAGDAGPLGD